VSHNRQPLDPQTGPSPDAMEQAPVTQPPGSAVYAHPADLEARRRQIAVALHHDQRRPGLPRVVASGRGAVAEQILAAAFVAGVKVREDADLAEILAAVEVDSEIPLEALAAVAEILSYVYRANDAEPRQALGARLEEPR